MTITDRDLLLWIIIRVLVAGMLALPGAAVIASDLVLFSSWSDQLAQGTVPASDMWQYPPGMALLLAGVGLLGLGATGLLVLILGADFGILLLLRRTRGATFWALAPLLTGPVMLTRLDTTVTFLALLGVVASRPWVSGLALGLGASLKVWPGALLSVLSRNRLAHRAASATVSLVLVIGLATAVFPTDRALENQRGRGLQVESVAAFPFLVARALGAPIEITFRYGASEIDSVLADQVASLLPVLTLAIVVLLAVWYWRRPDERLAPTRSLLLICSLLVTSRVLSPQFNVWVLGFVALMLTRGQASRGVLWTAAGTAVAAQLYYPWLYRESWLGLAIQGARLACLVALTWLLVRGQLRMRPGHVDGSTST